MNVKRLLALPLIALLLLLAPASEALARAVPFSAISVDARTGKVLFSSDPDGLRHPASLTKMMTLYMLFAELKAGRMTMQSPIVISARAASMSPSKLGVKPGTSIAVETAIRAIVVISANDVASAIGENLGGSEFCFRRQDDQDRPFPRHEPDHFPQFLGSPQPRPMDDGAGHGNAGAQAAARLSGILPLLPHHGLFLWRPYYQDPQSPPGQIRGR